MLKYLTPLAVIRHARRLVLTVDLDCDIRTHGRTDGAAIAFIFFTGADRMISLSVIFARWHNMALGTEMNAEVTLLAEFFFYLNVSFQSMSPNQFLPVIQLCSAVAILRIMFIMSSFFRLIDKTLPKDRQIFAI